jgi:sulfur-oxidizing protein SoxB
MDQKFSQRVDGIDVMVSGHTHNPVFDPVVWNNTIIYESGAHGEYVSSLDLEIKDGEISNYNYKLVKVKQDYISADPEIAQMVEEAYKPHAEKLNEVIGQADGLFYRRDYWQSTLGNLITDVLRISQGTDISLFPAWRYGATLTPGKITAEDIYNIIPTGGHVYTFTMAGKEIKLLLENIMDSVVNVDPYIRVGGDMIRFSGLNIVYDLDNGYGEKIVSITTSDGQPFLEGKDYSVASVHTRFQDNPLFGARNVVDTGKIFADELISYIRTNSPISAGLDARITSRGSAKPGIAETASTN